MYKTIKMIDIIVVNWNAGKQLKDLIESLAEHHSNLIKCVVVVDNDSTDGSLESLISDSDKYQDFKLIIIRNEANIGFGAACNKGARECTSEFLLFLNPDAVVYKDTLSIVSDFMLIKENAEIGICGIQLIDKDGQISRTCARFPTPISILIASLGLNRLSSSIFKSMHMHDWAHDKTQYVDHVIGAFYFVRNIVFKQLNGFNERFFVYLEDLDFSLRAHINGYKSIYLTQAKSFHLGGGTSNQIKAIRLFYSLRSRLIYSQIHFSKLSLLLVFLFTLIFEPNFRILDALSKRSKQQFNETINGYKLLYKWSYRWIFGKS
jgi:GT2 family glycosyltransferase